MATGKFTQDGVSLDYLYTLMEGEISQLNSGPYSFEFLDKNGVVLYQKNFNLFLAQ